ncbi:hypothetical protein [Halobacterium hubeiense]|uniref:hypothetical protein n=1 Tax=Halobacterium hubeiense TaxID=1407499 RepID=UPI00117A30A9|nr:hypothetical protein [Halobacterium hubeiense]
MSDLVFSEGKNDVILLEELHESEDMGPRYDKYVFEDTEVSQTKWLRQQTADDRFDYLYKSEGGDGELIKKFKSHSLVFTKFSMRVLIDLDGGSFQDRIEEFNNKLSEDYGNKVRVDVESRHSNSDLIIAESTLRIEGDENRNLPILAFHESLEDVAGIFDGDSVETRRTKIQRYISNNPSIVSDISDCIYR